MSFWNKLITLTAVICTVSGVVVLGVGVNSALDAQIKGENIMTGEGFETNMEQARIYLTQAEEIIKNQGVEITSQYGTYSYNESNISEINLVMSDSADDNCAMLHHEGEARSGGCFHSLGNKLVISSNLGSKEKLRTLVLHEYAHYLQFNNTTIPSLDLALEGDVLPEVECLADEIAVHLGAHPSTLGYTESGQCTHTSKEVQLTPFYYEPPVEQLTGFISSLFKSV